MSFTTGIINPSEYTTTTTIGELTNDEYRNEIINAVKSVFDISTKKLHHFLDTYKSKVDNTYETKDTMLARHFFLETLEETNNNLRKDNKQYRINFSYNILFSFQDEGNEYLKEYNLYNDDGSINDDKLQTHLDSIEKIVTTYSLSKKLYIKPVHVDEHLLSVFS